MKGVLEFLDIILGISDMWEELKSGLLDVKQDFTWDALTEEDLQNARVVTAGRTEKGYYNPIRDEEVDSQYTGIHITAEGEKHYYFDGLIVPPGRLSIHGWHYVDENGRSVIVNGHGEIIADDSSDTPAYIQQQLYIVSVNEKPVAIYTEEQDAVNHLTEGRNITGNTNPYFPISGEYRILIMPLLNDTSEFIHG